MMPLSQPDQQLTPSTTTTLPRPTMSARQRNLRTAAIGVFAFLVLIIAYSLFPNIIAGVSMASFPSVKAVISGVNNGQIVHDGESVTFSATKSSGRSLTYKWEFSDGSSDANTQKVTRKFTYSGPFISTITVALTIMDPLKSSKTNHTDTTALRFRLYPQPPKADFTYQANSSFSGVDVTFTPTTPEDTIDHYEWNFGDGINGVSYPDFDPTYTHTYDKAGTYTVTLTAVDIVGQKTTATKSITAASPSV
jgi:PKD repeat protein